MHLTLLDLASSDVPGIARFIESLGYHRYWATEHHSPTQSGSPVLAAAVAAAATARIRVGTAGVLLHYTAPRRVVADFALLERQFGGRLDLGVAAAVVPDAVGEELLDGRPAPSFEGYAARVAAIVTMVRTQPLRLLGSGGHPPELWVCGRSVRSAELAGSLGVSYAFHQYLNQGPAATDGRAVVSAYRAACAANGHPPGRVSLACYGYCARRAQDAKAFWHRYLGEGNSDLRSVGSPKAPFRMTASFLGDPAECSDQLRALAEHYGAQDIAVEIIAPSPQARRECLRLLAEGLSLAAPSDRVSGSSQGAVDAMAGPRLS